MKHLFTFHKNIWDTLSFDTIYDTATDLKELDLLKPPYEEFDIQATLDKKILSMVFINVPPDLAPPVRTFTFRYAYNMEDGSVWERVKLFDKFYSIDQLATMASKAGGLNRELYVKEVAHISMFLLNSLMVLLATNNAQKTTEKIKKHGPKSRKRPREYDYITTIKIGKITETQRRDGDGQSSVRPHLRRGHIRNQRVGKGLSEVKLIFIQPCFINDDESGLHHDYEKWLEKLAPHEPVSAYRHNDTGEDNADAHMKRQIMGREVVVAVTQGQLDFGTWEQIFYGEFDGRRRKRVLVKIIGE